MASVHLQAGQLDQAKLLLDRIMTSRLGARIYLLYGSYAEYYFRTDKTQQALTEINQAIALCSNDLEKAYLKKKREQMVGKV